MLFISKNNYRLIAADLSKQTKLRDPQQINFIGKLEKDDGATMFFIIKKPEKTTFIFFTKFCHSYMNNGNTKNC